MTPKSDLLSGPTQENARTLLSPSRSNGPIKDTKNHAPIPWQVHLKDGNSRGFCGGTILDKKTVLTAAHCFNERDKYSDDYFVAAGVTDFNKNVKVSNPSQDCIYIYLYQLNQNLHDRKEEIVITF